uniref:BPTI/Kunitz inhibitor domain-containing protein n=1 Tax=Strongyloides venezuelensis TaxID=75913 RepID=A0A0K0EUE2_STRVS
MKFKRNNIRIFFIIFISLTILKQCAEALDDKTQYCSLPKSPGNCKDKIQRFYYDPIWMMCLAFVYTGCDGNGNSFNTKAECEHSCLLSDGSSCLGPNKPKPVKKPGTDCDSIECPEGYKCVRGAFHHECCHEIDYKNLNEAYESKCPDGSNASGVFTFYFQPTIAKTCDDLVCEDGKKCVQVNSDFAKCCGRSAGNITSPKN